MQVNREEMDTVLSARFKKIENRMMNMRHEVGNKSQEWTKVRNKLAEPYSYLFSTVSRSLVELQCIGKFTCSLWPVIQASVGTSKWAASNGCPKRNFHFFGDLSSPPAPCVTPSIHLSYVHFVCPMQVLLGAKDGVLRVRAHAIRRTRDTLAATEARISVLQAELAESEHHEVGLFTGKQYIRNMYDLNSAS